MTVGFQKLYFSSDPLALEKSFLSTFETSRLFQTRHILIPNYYVASHLRHKLAEQKALLNVRFVTFKDLSRQLLRSNSEFLSKIHMTSEIELHQIGQIAQNVLQKTEREVIANKKGFHQNLRKLFHHLILQGAKKLPPVDDKVRSFDQIFQKYLELKKKYYNDPWLIESAATEKNASDVLYLSVYGFTQLSSLEIKFLENLSKHTTISMWMERLFFEDIQETIFTWAGNEFSDSEEIQSQSKPQLIIQPAAHLQDEASWIAQTILENQRKHPVPFHRIGIFLNDERRQKTYIEQTFQKYQIPYVTYGGTALTRTNLGKGLQNLAELLFQNWNRDEWIRFLQSFPFPSNIYEQCGTPDEWNEWTVESQITDKGTFLIQRLEYLQKKEGNSKLQSFIDWQKKMFSTLDQIEKIFSKDIPIFFQRFLEWIQMYADAAAIQDEYAALFDQLIYFSKSLDGPFSWIETKTIFLDLLQKTSIQEKGFESDGVFVAPLSMLPGLSFDVVFLPYVNEGVFPKPIAQNFDLSSQEMFLITQKTGAVFPSTEKDFEMQRIFFETAKSRANQLFISYSEYSLPDQNELRPSVFLQGLKQKKPFHNLLEPMSSNKPDAVLSKNLHQYYEAMYSNHWSHYNALISDPDEKKVYSASDVTTYLTCPRKYYLSKALGLSKEDHPEERFQIDPKDKGSLVHAILFQIYSQLKTKNLFPLNIQKETEILQIASNTAEKTLDQFTVGNAYGSEEMWKIDREELLNDITQYIKQEIREGKYWAPHALEYSFGMKLRGDENDPQSTEKQVTLPVLQKELSFRGKVDRIDLSPDRQRMRIVDYKTGAFKHVNWNYEKGTNLQIPIYMLLSRHFFPDIQTQQTEGTLVHIKTFSKFDRRVLPHESLANAEESIFNLLDLVDTGIQQGKFYPYPGNNRSNCMFCDFQIFCGENIDRDIESIPTDEFMDQYKTRKDLVK